MSLNDFVGRGFSTPGFGNLESFGNFVPLSPTPNQNPPLVGALGRTGVDFTNSPFGGRGSTALNAAPFGLPAGSPGLVGGQSAVDATNDSGFGSGFDDFSGGFGGESDQGGAPSGGSQSGGHAGGYGGPGTGHGAGPTGTVSVGDRR